MRHTAVDMYVCVCMCAQARVCAGGGGGVGAGSTNFNGGAMIFVDLSTSRRTLCMKGYECHGLYCIGVGKTKHAIVTTLSQDSIAPPKNPHFYNYCCDSRSLGPEHM